MRAMKKDNESAVSPVVGVMLMLVVTIIIAALVSAYAGGLGTGTSKAPQVGIQAKFSNTTGLTISHTGGDTVNTLKTKIVVSPSDDFGSYGQLRWVVNSSVVSINRNGTIYKWFDPVLDTSSLARTFQPGETAFVNVTDLSQVQPGTYRANTYVDPQGRWTDAFSSYYGFMNQTAQGERFNLMLVDDSGKTFATTVVTINP